MSESPAELPSSESLIEAIIRNDIRRVRALLEYGVSSNGLDEESKISPLHVAIEHQRLGIIELLIDAGADVNEDEVTRGTPLTHALDIEHFSGDHPFGVPAEAEITTLLVARGANVNQVDSNGDTPLAFARSIGHLKAIEVLVENGAT